MPRTSRKSPKSDHVADAAVPAEELKEPFPPITLPIQPPYPPMEAKLVSAIPSSEEQAGSPARAGVARDGVLWQYEPKWDGFRCLAFRKNDEVLLQSKAGQPLGRYFPEIVAALQELPLKQFVLDGEIVILRGKQLSFDD